MNLLIVEDDPTKADQIHALVIEVKPDAQVEVSASLTDAVRLMERAQFDLVILDFMIPVHDSGTPIDCSGDLLHVIKRSSRNRASCLVALTAYDDLVGKMATEFAKAGVIICKYSAHEQSWQPTIRSLVERHSIRSSRRFVIICALESERQAFKHTSAVFQKPMPLSGLDTCEIKVGEERGVVVLCPRMGLVNASIVAALAIDRFAPEIVCMAGICAGISNKTQIGQILVAHPCFEYQVGKFTPTGFEIEQYQISLDESLRQSLNGLSSEDDLVASLYHGLASVDIKPSIPKLCTFVSGSAVVADQTVISNISRQHRKLAGLDMEAFGVMQAAALANCEIKAFCAKAVVDHADNHKGDRFQADACIVSARYCVAAVSRLLGQPIQDRH